MLFMKKKVEIERDDPDMLDDYDFSQGVRGKYVQRFAQGSNIVVLSPEIAKIFPDSESVNRALQLLMAEQLMQAADQDLMLDTPFLRRIREEGREEGRSEGQVEGLVESILDVMITRLELSAPTYRRLERQISTITDVDRLRELLQVAIRATDVADFEQALEE